MLTFDADQTSLVADDSKEYRWVFTVTDNTDTAVSTPVITDFSGIDLKRNTSETGIVAPSEVTFTISDAGDVIGYSNLKGGTVLIELYITSPTVAEHKIAGWMFKIKTAEPGYQQIKIVAQDFLQDYLQGYYPNTRLPEEIFPSSRTYVGDMVCVPVPFGEAYVPLRDVFITDAGYLMLGDPARTYTIEKIRSPRSLGMKSEWDHASFTFTQSTKADADAVDWRVFQAIIADGNNDGTVDTHGFWNVGPSLDPPVLFSRDDTATTTNPADIIAFVLEDMGVPSAMIDDGVGGSFAAAHAIFDAYTVPLVFNGAFWYKQDRQKVLSQLLTQCHACLDVGETIKMRVLSKTSKATITDADVLRTSDQGPGSFQYQDLVNEDLSDAAYGAYQETGEAQDELQQVLVSTGGAATVISSEVIPCPFVQDSRDVKRIVTLTLQRKLGKVASVNWLNKGTGLALQPDDVLTVNDSNYGGSHTVLIDSMKINKDLSIQFSCTKFKQALSDWADLSPTTQVIPVDDTTHPWSPVISGPDSPGTPIPLNAIADRLRVGNGAANYILIEPADPRISLYNSGEKWRVGNLNGYLGVASDLFGLGIGESGAGKANLIYDVTDGLRLRSGTTNVVNIDNAGNITISGGISASTIDIGGADTTSFHVDVDGNMWLGAAAYNIATNPFAVSNAGVLRAVSGTVGGWTLATDKLSAGTDANYIGFAPATGIQLGDSTFADAPFSVTPAGVVKAISGTIGGWTLAATKLSAGTDADYIGFEPSVGIQLGDSTFADAPFSVTKAGVLKATSATITGAITASSGSVGSFTIGTYLYTGSKTAYNDANAGVHLGSDGIGIGNNVFTVSAVGALVATSATITGVITANTGKIGGANGWVISANYIKDVAGVTGLSSVVTAGDDIRFWAGHATPASAPFYVTEAGALVATSATITGAITATSGTFTGTVNAADGYFGGSTNGWVIAAGSLTAKGTSIFQTSASASTGIKIDSTSLRGYNGTVQTVNIATDGSGWVGLTGTKAIQWTAAGVVSLGNWTVNASSIQTGAFDTAGTMYFGTSGISLSNTFKVTAAGVLTATGATISGAITATSGTFTGAVNATSGKFGTSTNYWSVGATGLTATIASTDVKIAYGKSDFGDATLGFILGYDFSASKPKFEMGNATDSIAFDGSTWTYTKGVIKETIIQMYTSVATIRTSATAGDGSAASAGMVVTYEGLFGCGANQTATIAAANANVRILATGAAFFSGTITAGAGAIGGFTIGADYIKDAADSFGLASTVTAGDDVRFWAGDTFANRATADFRITEAGALYASSATIIGDYKTSATVGTTAGVHLDVTNNELYFYGDCGDGTIEKLASIGITSSGGDLVIGNFGSGTSTRVALSGRSSIAAGVYGQSESGVGVNGTTESGYGVGGRANTTGHGVHGYSFNSYGVYGISANSYAIYSDGTTYLGGNTTIADAAWLGLGAAKGRIQFDDEATDTITFLNGYPIVQLDAALLGQFQRITTTTSGAYIQIQNGHRTILGTESSAGATIVAGTLAYSTFLSSLDGDPLHLCVGNAPYLTIGATGGVHVGGTSDPGADNLLVDGTLHVDGIQTSAGIIMDNNATIGQAAGPLIAFDDTNNYLEITGCNVGIGTTGPVSLLHLTKTATDTLGNENAALGFNSDGINPMWGFQVAATNSNLMLNREYSSTAYNVMTWDRTNGNVGIGTTSPGEKLSVYGAVNTVLGSYFAPLADTNYAVWKLGKSAATNESMTLTYIYDTTVNDQYVGFGFSGGADVFGYKRSGNVGIGSISPISLTEIQGGLTTTGAVLTLGSKETSTVANDVLGRINFYAPLDASGTDAILPGASIVAMATATFSASVNSTALCFQTGNSETAVGQTRMQIGATGGVTVGNSGTDPGLDNLLVDGTITGASIKASGAEQLKIWTYTHTVTAGEVTATYSDFTITSVTLAKIRGILAVIRQGGAVITTSTDYLKWNQLTSTTNLRVSLGVYVEADAIISITIIEAV